MKSLKLLSASAVLSAGILAGTAQVSHAANIVETARANGSFTSLVASLEATGLDTVLSGEGPYTVFAPTDAAFAALPSSIVTALLQKDQETLSQILTYHVVAGSVSSGTVVGSDTLTSVQGDTIDVTVNGESVKVDAANITVVDIATDNGIIHVIDSVILPDGVVLPPTTTSQPTIGKITSDSVKVRWAEVAGADAYRVRLLNKNGKIVQKRVVKDGKTHVKFKGLKSNTHYRVQVQVKANTKWGIYSEATSVVTKGKPTIFATAKAAGSFTTLVAALEATGLDEVLKTKDGTKYTVFAPTDAAFAKLPAGTVEALLANPDELSDILLYHVVAGRYVAADVTAQPSVTVTTAQGSTVTINTESDGVYIDGAKITTTDIKTSNGIIHVIDSVILP